MFDELQKYLLLIRLRLDKNQIKGASTDMLMEEISKIVIENWIDNDSPDLSEEQIGKAITRVIARIYNRN